MHAVDEFKKHGFNIWLDGGKIRYKQQIDDVDQDKVSSLLAEIKNHKDEAIQYLQSQEQGITRQDDQLDINSLNPDFSKANLVIKFHSDLLNEDFFLVSNSKLKAKVEAENLGTVVYLPGEIEHLAGLKPEELKKLHLMRKAFGGEFIARGKAEDSIFNQPKEELTHYRYPALAGADPRSTSTQKPWSIADCPSCSCYIHWPNYPLSGGIKNFCGYEVLVQGKSKKVEISKNNECPKKG